MGEYIYSDGSEGPKTLSGGSTDQTEEFTVQGNDQVYLFVEGTDASNFDVQLQSRFETDGTWHDVDGESKDGVDVSTSNNNALAIGPFDVEALELAARFELVEQSSTDEDLTMWVGESKDRG